MAYGEKYFLTFCNANNQPCRVSILHIDYEGEPIELIGNQEPIVISYDNSEDFKFEPIIPSEATINLIFDDEALSFQELWTSNERTFKVEYFVDEALEWTGFIIPSGFDYVLKGGFYEAELNAKDGLSTLKGILFKTDNNELYGTQDLSYNDGFNFPFILILTEILRKLDLGIDLWTLVDYYEQTMSELNENSRESDPLAVSFVNVKTYINDTDRKDIPYFQDVNEAWDCMKILENICHIWGSRIYQEKGVWRLKSIHADSAIAHDYTSESDSFVGENPEKDGNFWKYECYYSTSRDINFDDTVFFFSKYNTVNLLDKIYSDGGTNPSVKGFYLIKGLNKLVEVDNSGNIINISFYAPAVSDYYWKKYNNTAGYLGRELASSGSIIPCYSKDLFIKENDSEVRMDEVYKQFRVNYEYSFIRDGDSPINLIRNGNFAIPFEQYGGFEAPPSWERWRVHSSKYYPRGRVIELETADYKNTGGNTNALEMFIQYNNVDTPKTDHNPAVWAAYFQEYISVESKVDVMYFKGWVKFRYKLGDRFFFPVFRAFLFPLDNKNGNPFEVGTTANLDYYVLDNIIDDEYDLGWRKESWNRVQDHMADYFRTYPSMGTQWDESEQETFKWYDFNLKVQPVPVPGNIDFFIHGLCATNGKDSHNFPPFWMKINKEGEMADNRFYTVRDMGDPVPRPQFTGLELGYIPDPNEEVPKADYIYANGDVNYTFQNDPIEIYNGDGFGDEIISNITVESNAGGTNRWDTFNNAFGTSYIGMISCKSIMQQYYKPKRLLDCDFKAPDFKYGDIILFDHIPDIKFIMLRGSFNAKRGYWEDCTLAEISNDNIAPGGITNGHTLTPSWQSTGRFRCVKDDDGLNTGIQEYETIDVNTNSDSFGNYRWQVSGTNLTSCPIGEPSKYYWGTDQDDYDTDNFTDFNITYEDEDIGEVQVGYNNTGGKYIYFLHLASLGSVVQVSNQFQGQIISSFTYLSDVTINGYLYRVLRQDFVTSEFKDFQLTFYIQ